MKDIGLVLVQPTPQVAHEPLISGVEHGLEEILIKSDMRLVTRVVRDSAAELAVYRSWNTSKAVDAVVLVRLTRGDRRIAFLEKLGVPFAAIADESQLGDFSAVAIDYAGMMHALVAHLTDRGHTKIVFVSGAEELSSIRAAAFLAEARAGGFDGHVRKPDPAAGGSDAVTREILADDDPPTAIVYDDDLSAAAGLVTIQALGLSVPGDVAVVAWNDSVRCQSAKPSITAMSNEAHTVGMLVGQSLLETVATGEATLLHAPNSFIVEREST